MEMGEEGRQRWGVCAGGGGRGEVVVRSVWGGREGGEGGEGREPEVRCVWDGRGEPGEECVCVWGRRGEPGEECVYVGWERGEPEVRCTKTCP